MTEVNSTVVELTPRIARSGAHNHASWKAITKAAILPAYRLCAEKLENKGTEPWICESAAHHMRPFIILAWNGTGALSGTRLGLHFTYGDDKMRFDVSAVRDVINVRHQGSFYTEFFSSTEQELSARILMRASYGLGKAMQIENGPLPHIEWTTSQLARPS